MLHLPAPHRYLRGRPSIQRYLTLYSDLIPSSFNGSGIRGRSARFQLGNDSAEYFLHTYGRCRALVIPPFVEKLFEQRRDNLRLDSVTVNFPRAGAGKERDAAEFPVPSARCIGRLSPPTRHRWFRTSARCSKREDRFGRMFTVSPSIFKPHFQYIVIGPLLHRPDRPGVGGDRDIARQSGFDWFR